MVRRVRKLLFIIACWRQIGLILSGPGHFKGENDRMAFLTIFSVINECFKALFIQELFFLGERELPLFLQLEIWADSSAVFSDSGKWLLIRKSTLSCGVLQNPLGFLSRPTDSCGFFAQGFCQESHTFRIFDRFQEAIPWIPFGFSYFSLEVFLS